MNTILGSEFAAVEMMRHFYNAVFVMTKTKTNWRQNMKKERKKQSALEHTHTHSKLQVQAQLCFTIAQEKAAFTPAMFITSIIMWRKICRLTMNSNLEIMNSTFRIFFSINVSIFFFFLLPFFYQIWEWGKPRLSRGEGECTGAAKALGARALSHRVRRNLPAKLGHFSWKVSLYVFNMRCIFHAI